MAARRAETDLHDEQASLRPEVGTKPQFKKRKQPTKYRYDDSLSPALEWDGQNPGRELGEWLLAQIEEAARLDPPHRFSEPRRCEDVVVDGLDDALAAVKALSAWPAMSTSASVRRVTKLLPLRFRHSAGTIVQEQLGVDA
jgi:adenine-specific DNA-methyltransferase